jgi:arylsulfatase A-like enzyme
VQEASLRYVLAKAQTALPFILLSVLLCFHAPPAASKPNIILLIADDLPVSLVEHLPTVKAEIIAKGATFNQAFFNNPLCCPSRAAMLTGKYVQNNKTTDQLHSQFYNAGNPDRTVAVWLKNAGYRTALVGKYLNGYPSPRGSSYVPPGWDYWIAKRGGGLYYDYTLSENSTPVSYGHDPEDYSTDLYKTKALGFLKGALADRVPFLLWFSPSSPHAPHTPAPRHVGLFPNLKAPKPASFNEADLSDKPGYVRAQPRLTASQIASLDEDYRMRVLGCPGSRGPRRRPRSRTSPASSRHRAARARPSG